jgi:hypothetical protein
MAKGKPSNSELRATTHKFVSVVDGLARVLQALLKWGGICAIAYFAYKSIASLSGQTTVANLALKVLGNLTISQSVAYTVAGGSAVWALGERSLRKKTVAKLSERLKNHETDIDKTRTSSTLPKSGNTRKEDL